MSALQKLLRTYRQAAVSEREKGTYFEELICTYLRNEATYRDLYSKVWTYAAWAKEQGLDARDTGIDLVALTQGTGEYHAIQCKFYAEDYRVSKGDLDSFFTASGKKPFVRRVIITTTDSWGEHALDALQNQQPPVNRIDLHDLENSQIDWALYHPHEAPALKPKKTLREHQATALASVAFGLQSADRGKMIMACGTGKTFTSLKVAEKLAGLGGRVLFLVPSLSLLSQTLTEWTQESETPLHSFAVCSDSDVGHKRKKDDDIVQTFAHELRYPATTEPGRLALEMAKRHDDQHMSVVFSTYHSIDVISRAQHEFALGEFDLIICDEAHRTTGVKFDSEDESAFVKVHDADFIRAKKRLYMTATPRIYSDVAEAQAEQDKAELYGMNREDVFGKELFVITFSDAVKRGLLVDYKVIVLAVDEAHVSRRLQSLLSDENNSLKVDDAAKIVGCWKALSKQDTQADLIGDEAHMRRAVAFCQVIEPQKNARSHKVSSKNIAGMFQAVVEAYQEKEAEEEFEIPVAVRLKCEAAHVDGSMNASQKEAKLDWLKAETPEHTCRILSNVRCLSEGVDVPALDAVVFLTPRNSQVDVVQSVGRVMRNAPGKKRGYVILPVVIPAGKEAHEALSDNKIYQVVWQVLQALRSHDDRFDAMVNKLDLIGKDTTKMEVIAITDKIVKKAPKATTAALNKQAGKNKFSIGEPAKKLLGADDQGELQFEIGEIERAIYAKVVQKCGNRHHWEDWAKDIADIARTHIVRITGILEDQSNTRERTAFESFATELRDDLNDSITNGEVIEMLAQHLITKPVFDALFEGYSFAQNNPMSRAMQGVLDVLQEHKLDKEADTLQRFYDSVKLRAEGIESAEGKQKIIVELYDKFFANAFPRLKEKLGIVYTPVEVVDFIIHSVDDILRTEFDQSLASDNVHILDPFTGTGTFITRLLQSGLISRADLPKKYASQIHANEIVLLAYYIAAINIESVYHDIVGGAYVPFEGICLTDTFQLHEKDDLISDVLVANSDRRKKQKALDIRVILGNPPYSVGQERANDNNQNVVYPYLDQRIRETYAECSTATNKNGLYDSYIRAIRWASDRVGDSGVIGFVTNASFLEANTSDGLRKCLAQEFSSIYVLHLRGNQRTSGELSRKEGGKIFGSGSRAPIAISLLVKNPAAKAHGQIHWHDIGDYLTREEKLERLSTIKGVAGATTANLWRAISPDSHGDWLKQRDGGFADYIALGAKKDKEAAPIFLNYSGGVKTNRDAWCYNASKEGLQENMTGMLAVYQADLASYKLACDGLSKERWPDVELFSTVNPAQISWNRGLKNDLERHLSRCYSADALVPALYRPYTKQWLYFDKNLNDMVYQIPYIFPTSTTENLVICLNGVGAQKDFSVLMSDRVPDIHVMQTGQCFPMYLYERRVATETPTTKPQPSLFSAPAQAHLESYTIPEYTRRDAVSDAGLAHFQAAYPGESITKEDLFYYIYGLLHSPDYRSRYADSLTKELPRIPRVSRTADFWAFSKAGRALAELHLNYESVPCYPVSFSGGSLLLDTMTPEDFRVVKMKYGKRKEDGKNVDDKSSIFYNHRITLTGIPLAAYDYVVNGKPAIDWVMERQAVTEHKESGIVNDANLWATETVGNARYPLELLQRVITVSLETMKIVNGLPALDVMQQGAAGAEVPDVATADLVES